MKQKIIRADGIEYERKIKSKNYDGTLFLRIESDKLEKLKKKANKNNRQICDIVREMIYNYIESEEK